MMRPPLRRCLRVRRHSLLVAALQDAAAEAALDETGEADEGKAEQEVGATYKQAGPEIVVIGGGEADVCLA